MWFRVNGVVVNVPGAFRARVEYSATSRAVFERCLTSETVIQSEDYVSKGELGDPSVSVWYKDLSFSDVDSVSFFSISSFLICEFDFAAMHKVGD